MTKYDIKQFCSLMQFGSLSNSDAFGIFTAKENLKNKGMFDLSLFEQKAGMENGRFMIGHNRLMTTKNNEDNKNNHPFALGELTLVHNGVIANYDELVNEWKIPTKITTDSYAILWLIDYEVQKANGIHTTGKERVRLVAKAIEKTAERLEGSYSVLLYDRVSDKVFYFKNSHTAFSLTAIGTDYLVGSTDRKNLKYVFHGMGQKNIPVRNWKVYVLDGNKLRVIGTFKEQAYLTMSNNLWDRYSFGCSMAGMDDYYEFGKNNLCDLLNETIGAVNVVKVTEEYAILESDPHLKRELMYWGIWFEEDVEQKRLVVGVQDTLYQLCAY
ncbi:class II glutamine amidotransferase [Gimesia panareensis]|uniref:class II glutamine amidotransferase n=1 Tax=Gimesia panareensis TaxID=2527978 RepID=UPI0018D8E3FB|nr:hypothetical protein [Gimesia panareensis]